MLEVIVHLYLVCVVYLHVYLIFLRRAVAVKVLLFI